MRYAGYVVRGGGGGGAGAGVGGEGAEKCMQGFDVETSK